MKIIEKIDTGYCADSVEWCTHNLFRNFLALGTYQLIEKERKRKGRLTIYHHKDNGIHEIFKWECPGILDMKWECGNRRLSPLLATVHADGSIHMFSLGLSGILHEQTSFYFDEKIVLLSLDWSNRVFDVSSRICISDNRGYISIVSFSEGAFICETSWKAHSFDAWICAYDNWSCGNLIYSGGDDNLLKLWDLRQETTQPVAINKSHRMGICSIQSHSLKEHIFASGSYDEYIRIWDKRNIKSPLTELLLNGGVWRIKWHPNDPFLLLAACMDSGFHVAKLNESQSGLHKIFSYNGHASLAYGADWKLPLYTNDIEHHFDTIATCSFYDHAMHVWQIPSTLYHI